jgi:transposase-like protein
LTRFPEWGPVRVLSSQAGLVNHWPMNRSANPYKRHRFPPAIIQYAVWLYHRFNLSHRDIEDLLAERGIEVTYESVRLWSNKFGPLFSKRLKRK